MVTFRRNKWGPPHGDEQWHKGTWTPDSEDWSAAVKYWRINSFYMLFCTLSYSSPVHSDGCNWSQRSCRWLEEALGHWKLFHQPVVCPLQPHIHIYQHSTGAWWETCLFPVVLRMHGFAVDITCTVCSPFTGASVNEAGSASSGVLVLISLFYGQTSAPEGPFGPFMPCSDQRQSPPLGFSGCKFMEQVDDDGANAWQSKATIIWNMSGLRYYGQFMVLQTVLGLENLHWDQFGDGKFPVQQNRRWFCVWE